MTTDTRPSPLPHLPADTLLVQTDANSDHYLDAVSCSDRPGGGLVLTGEKALITATYVRQHKHYSRPLLIDRDRYSGKNRLLAAHAFDNNWISRQRDLGVAGVLPDAGYIGEGDEAGLASILARVHDLGPDVIAPLALHVTWLDRKRGLPVLLEHVGAAGVPIAIALEHQADPLDQRYAVSGLLNLLALPIPVIVLRCDISAIGALCFGARAAAVGTRTGLRHIFPPDNGGGGGTAKIAALVRGCLAFVSLDKLDLAMQADPENAVWICRCVVCADRTLDWLGSAPDPEAVAYLHSLETLYQIRSDVVSAHSTDRQRQQSWVAQCSSAQFHHIDLGHTVPIWGQPRKALGHWFHLGSELLRPRTRS